MSTVPAKPPLVVDVDDSLVCGDTLIESLIHLLSRAPRKIFRVLGALVRGRAAFKRAVADAVDVAPDAFVFRQSVIDEMRRAQTAGREVWLASAADEKIVAALAQHFDAHGHLASDGKRNLGGAIKARALCEQFGARGFAYVGDSRRDLAVWRLPQCIEAIGVNLSTRLQKRARRACANARFINDSHGIDGADDNAVDNAVDNTVARADSNDSSVDSKTDSQTNSQTNSQTDSQLKSQTANRTLTRGGAGNRARDYWRALRPHQWSKNALVFAALIADHAAIGASYWSVVAAFVALSACASAAYLINDIVDLPHDRRHAHNRRRPLAAGRIAVLPSLGLAVVLLSCGLLIAFVFAPDAGRWLLLYVVATFAYSLVIKRMLFADVIVLATLYTLRVLIGASAALITPSDWFLAFFILMFLALALVKRQIELNEAGDAIRERGRGYRAGDLTVLTALTAGAMFAAMVVLMLYIHDAEVADRYTNPRALWLVIAALVYWLGRMLLLAHRGAIDGDPVAFALRDRVSWLSGALLVAFFTLAL